jgi:DnaK suppressor protein
MTAMTRYEIDGFRKALEASESALSSSTGRRDAIVVEGRTADELERMHRANEREIALRTLEVVSTKLREVRAALRRIEDGSYGTCLECDGEIGPKRLAALPWATLCILCQEATDCHCAARIARPSLALAA